MYGTQLLFGLLVRPRPISVFGVLYASKKTLFRLGKNVSADSFRVDSSKNTLSRRMLGKGARVRFFRRLDPFQNRAYENIVRIKNNHGILTCYSRSVRTLHFPSLTLIKSTPTRNLATGI